MTVVTEAERNIMLHERVNVLEAKVRELNDFDLNVRQPQVRELRACVLDLWECYDFATRGKETAQKMRLRMEMERLGIRPGKEGR